MTTALSTHPQTREQWLELAVLKLRPLFEEINVSLPAVRVSVGWPSKGGTRSKGKVIGQCWATSVSADRVAQLFISPLLGGDREDEIKMLGVLLHELIHAADDCKSGHKGKFRDWARALGLTGKMTATVVEHESDLWFQLSAILDEIGAYPHSRINFEEMEKVAGEKKQGTRMLKLEAGCCGYIVRTTAKWIETGMPSCPCGFKMELA